MNYQTCGLMMDLNDGRFMQNGGCGYVLKPAIMREEVAHFSANSKDNIPGIAPQTVRIKVLPTHMLFYCYNVFVSYVESVSFFLIFTLSMLSLIYLVMCNLTCCCYQVISAQQLPKPYGSGAKGDTVDPYVTIEVFGIPIDCANERTRTVKNNG